MTAPPRAYELIASYVACAVGSQRDPPRALDLLIVVYFAGVVNVAHRTCGPIASRMRYSLADSHRAAFRKKRGDVQNLKCVDIIATPRRFGNVKNSNHAFLPWIFKGEFRGSPRDVMHGPVSA